MRINLREEGNGEGGGGINGTNAWKKFRLELRDSKSKKKMEEESGDGKSTYVYCVRENNYDLLWRNNKIISQISNRESKSKKTNEVFEFECSLSFFFLVPFEKKKKV